MVGVPYRLNYNEIWNYYSFQSHGCKYLRSKVMFLVWGALERWHSCLLMLLQKSPCWWVGEHSAGAVVMTVVLCSQTRTAAATLPRGQYLYWRVWNRLNSFSACSASSSFSSSSSLFSPFFFPSSSSSSASSFSLSSSFFSSYSSSPDGLDHTSRQVRVLAFQYWWLTIVHVHTFTYTA